MLFFFFFSSRRRHTSLTCDWSSDVCSSDLSARCRRKSSRSSLPPTFRHLIDGIGMPEAAVTTSPAFDKANPLRVARLAPVPGVDFESFAAHEIVALGFSNLL